VYSKSHSCDVCKKEFTASSPRALRCSSECKRVYRNQQERQMYQASISDRICFRTNCDRQVVIGNGSKQSIFCYEHKGNPNERRRRPYRTNAHLPGEAIRKCVQINCGIEVPSAKNRRYCDSHRKVSTSKILTRVQQKANDLSRLVSYHKPCEKCGQPCRTRMCVECTPPKEKKVRERRIIRYMHVLRGPLFKPEGTPWFPGWNGPYSPNVDAELLEKHYGKVY
jgi:hypothetical protein